MARRPSLHHYRCHHCHRYHRRRCTSPVSSSLSIIHGTRASFEQKGRSRECRRPPVNMAQRPISSKRLVTRASPTGHYRIWHEGQCWQKVGREGIPDHHILWHKRPIRAKVGRAIADHWQTWHKGQYGQKAGRAIEIADHQLWHKGQYCERHRRSEAPVIWAKVVMGKG